MRFLLASLILASSVSAQVVPVPPRPANTNPTRGENAWKISCMGCHTSPKGWDLAHFNYADTIIVRRALGHVHNDTTAWDIYAHIASLVVSDTMTPIKRPFQPGGVVLANDSVFGVTLFGTDQIPDTLSRTWLKNLEPLTMKIALPLAPWSDEASPVDWLSGTVQQDSVIPTGVMNATRAELARYNSSKTVANALRVAKRIRNAAHDQNIPDAPCTYGTVLSRYNAALCADIGKWAGTFLYVAGLEMQNLHTAVASFSPEFWETGHLFHKAQQNRRPLPNRDHNIAWWMHVGWMWDYAPNKASSYEAGPLDVLGHSRLATIVVLKTQVERRIGVQVGSNLACADAMVLAQFGSRKWSINAMRMSYKEIQFRAINKMLPPTGDTNCISNINQAQLWVSRRSGLNVRAQLQPLADSTITIVRAN